MIQTHPSTKRKKILFVAMHNSVHTARWISQLTEEGWDIHLFSVYDYDNPHPSLNNIRIYFLNNEMASGSRVQIKNLYPLKQGSRARKLSSKLFPQLENRAYWLARVIKKIQPDIVHSMEMQHAGYLTYDAKMLYRGKFPPWIYSCWGSDIYYFQQFKDHRKRISEVLTNCDYLFTDCNRDIDLARKYGFRGEMLGVYPGVGGFKINEMLELGSGSRPSERRTIVIKGYSGWVHRPMTILKALRLCAKEIKGYSVVIYLPGSEEIVNFAQEVCNEINACLYVVPRSPHSEIIKLFSNARISLASSISDGTPNSMLESMVMGALPIQSDTISTREWIEDGRNGFLVEPESVDGYAKALKNGLVNDNLVDSASEYNISMLKNRIDFHYVQEKVVNEYYKILFNHALS